ncbi:MAG: ribonuclease HII [Candidatus Kariarchaeaceae archaeon]
MSKKYIAGMDEAGRGPAIGPMVFGIVLVTPKEEKQLLSHGVKDSKALSSKRREEYAKKIEEISSYHATLVVSATKIDELMEKGTNLNKIEVISFRQLLKPYGHKIGTLQLDAADVNAERFGNKFRDLVDGEILSFHKGDAIFLSVGAASILAKVKRDHIINNLQREMKKTDPELPPFGSGYPTDAKPFLMGYVKKYLELPDIARKSWKTCKKILEEVQQSSLDW